MGIDTVSLNGNGFDVLVSEGQHVEKDEHIMNADLDVIKNAGLNTTVVLVEIK